MKTANNCINVTDKTVSPMHTMIIDKKNYSFDNKSVDIYNYFYRYICDNKLFHVYSLEEL